LIGMAIGVAGALALGRVLSTLIYGVQASDPLTFVGVSAILAVVALLASLIPAFRATRVEPIKALREE
jgi:putative ABC transport system permease protein